MSRFGSVALVLVLGAVVAFSAGCMKCGSDLAERAAERMTEEIVENETGENVKVDAGSAVDLAGMPAFMRYPGAKGIGKFSISTDEGDGTVWTLETSDARAKVGEWYVGAFEGAGWKKAAEMEAGESLMLMWTTSDEKESATLMLLDEDAKTSISLTHAKK